MLKSLGAIAIIAPVQEGHKRFSRNAKYDVKYFGIVFSSLGSCMAATQLSKQEQTDLADIIQIRFSRIEKNRISCEFVGQVFWSASCHVKV